MTGSSRLFLLFVTAALVSTVTSVMAPGTADAHPVCPAPVVTGDRLGRNESPHSNAFDGNEHSSFFSSFDNWQFVEIDFGCVSTFSGLRRKMGAVKAYDRGQGVTFNGTRAMQGETFSYSVDGRSWTNATHGTTFGWENYGPYTGVAMDAWHSVEYGWSDKIQLDAPVQARYVRFQWDGDGDMLYEVEVDFERAGPLQAALSCLRGEPVCTVTASGGHAGGYGFSFTGTGVAGGQQFDGPTASTFIASCTTGASFTVTVDVTDSHGRTVTRSRTDRCTGPF